jgi:transposase
MVAAMITISELGDLTRFAHPRQLMAFLGLVPSEESSGNRRRQGAITKCGNSHARWLLIESAQAYRNPPQVSAALSQRQEGQPGKVKELSWRAQNRLHRRYMKLKARGKQENKVKVAVARELCAFIWELHRLLAKRAEVSTSRSLSTNISNPSMREPERSGAGRCAAESNRSPRVRQRRVMLLISLRSTDQKLY